jgi:hypothetical protein
MSIYLDDLEEILGDKKNTCLFPCIKDLVAHGLDPARFSDEDNAATRQDITQNFAAWFKYIGMSPSQCQQWMIDYCTGVLSAISSSSKSQIRHSTKSNIKYIYSSDVSFNCGCENNRFKAACERTCPVYEEMAIRAKEGKAEQCIKSFATTVESRARDNEIALQRTSVKDTYRDQFEKAIEVALNHINQGVSKQKVVSLLNDSGFKTRTGKRWSSAILGGELRKLSRSMNTTKE